MVTRAQATLVLQGTLSRTFCTCQGMGSHRVGAYGQVLTRKKIFSWVCTCESMGARQILSSLSGCSLSGCQLSAIVNAWVHSSVNRAQIICMGPITKGNCLLGFYHLISPYPLICFDVVQRMIDQNAFGVRFE